MLVGTFLLLAAPAAASASVVYNALPSTLPPNAPSQPFQAQQTFEFGDYIHLGGTDRKLTKVTVAMSDWALEATPANVAFCSANPAKCTSGGFIHPITLTVYSNHLAANGTPDTLLATKTENIFVPWRPVADPTCPGGTAWRAADTNCYNGFAFNAVFDLTSLNVTLPTDVIVSLAYNTQSYGTAPIGVDGPYNSLNVLVPESQPVSVGSDDSNNEVFWNTITAGWYADGGASGVGIFRKDTNWTPYGTIAMKIEAASPVVSIAGVKFQDTNGNGVKDTGEAGLSGWTIYIDTNNNSQLDSGEKTSVTGSGGAYSFIGLPAGTYTVRELLQSGWMQTYPSAGKYVLTLTSTQSATGKDFGNFKLGSISGMKFNDKNANKKKDAGEAGLSGWTIKLKKGNTVVASVVTNAQGNYTFPSLTAGTYSLSEVMQAGWVQRVAPGTVIITSGKNSTGNNFGNNTRKR